MHGVAFGCFQEAAALPTISIVPARGPFDAIQPRMIKLCLGAVAIRLPAGDNPNVKRKSVTKLSKKTGKIGSFTPNLTTGPFQSGAIVLVTLNNPREKFWGKVLALDPAGLSLCGIELASFEDATNMFISGEPLSAAALFIPMHRVERVELDSPSGSIPSLSQRFLSRTGIEPGAALVGPPSGRSDS